MKKLLMTILSINIVFGQTTMCYIENIQKPSQLKNKKLNGGECKGKFNLNQMKNNGWIVEDISISKNKSDNTLNYTYILKQKSITKQKIKTQNNNTNTNDIIKGKILYQTKCQSCHGIKGQKEPNYSNKLTNLTIQEFEIKMEGYNLHEIDKGSAIIMYPYAVDLGDVQKISKYLKSINVLK